MRAAEKPAVGIGNICLIVVWVRKAARMGVRLLCENIHCPLPLSQTLNPLGLNLNFFSSRAVNVFELKSQELLTVSHLYLTNSYKKTAPHQVNPHACSKTMVLTCLDKLCCVILPNFQNISSWVTAFCLLRLLGTAMDL